jgi:hypothetical protein
VEFGKSEKSGKIPEISGFWFFFQICEIPLSGTTGMQRAAAFSVQVLSRCTATERKTEKVKTICMACKGT